MNLEPQEKKSISNILQLGLEIEVIAQDAAFPAEKLIQLKGMIADLAAAKTPRVQQNAKIAEHLHLEMTVRHFVNFMIPFERLLEKGLRDDQFLVSSEDKSEIVQRRPLYFVLDNLRSAFNVGAIYRLADCVGATAIFHSGYTPAPGKTAMSTEHLIQQYQVSRLSEAINKLRAENIQTVALETGKNVPSLYQQPLHGPLAFVVGNERFGLGNEALSLVDEVRQIPMFGVKNSMNVAGALSVAAFEWSRQNT
jgi:23S rRNA (guanosine2251-2'-O)-methyltransferase